MTINNQEVDYAMDRARIDASGFDVIRAIEGQNCGECGEAFGEDEEILYIDGDDFPLGRLLCRVSKHYVAIIDKVINDTFDPSRGGTRCVYGYWKLESEV